MLAVERNHVGLADEILIERYKGLEKGLRDREDPVTWRTLATDLRSILGSPDPDHIAPQIDTFDIGSELVSRLIEGTYSKPLRREILWSIYGEPAKELILPSRKKVEPLEVLLLSGRYKTEGIFWSLADHLASLGKEVGVVNPVGHYNDGQTRIITPDLLARPVKTVIFLSSTQAQDGGDLNVLSTTLRALRNPNFCYMVDRVFVAMPMFGGSRGHKIAQAEEIGYEVLETINDSKTLINAVSDIKRSVALNPRLPIYDHVRSLRSDLVFPNVTFLTVDIHNSELPKRKFVEAGYEFISASPAEIQAEKTIEVLSEMGLQNLPKRIISCDTGSCERTDNYVHEMLIKIGGSIEEVYLKKHRTTAGKVDGCEIEAVLSSSLNSKGELVKEKREITSEETTEPCVLIYEDDMIDTGGTAIEDTAVGKTCFMGAKCTLFVATHPIFSNGGGEVLNKIGADAYILGDSLSTKRFEGERKIRIAGLAPSLAKAMGF